MNKKEMYALTDRLRGLYKNAWQLNDTDLMNEYYLAFKPYRYEDLNSALTEYIRKKGFFPDPSDLTSGLIKTSAAMANCTCPYSPAVIAKIYGQMDEMLSVGAMMKKDYIAAGLPHPAEARKRGWTADEWVRRCEEAGP